jgi:hypothetical protein
MRFQKFINETITIEYNKDTAKEDVEKAISIIKKDCRPFLKECKVPVYRGMYFGEATLMEKVPRLDRRPKDMPEYLHKILDSLFQEHFGWKARSQGVFCTFHRGQAQSYGNAFLFFPIGEYKYILAPNLEDLYVDIRDKYKIPLPKMSDSEMEQLYGELLQAENMDARRLLNKICKGSIWLGQSNKISSIIKDMPDNSFAAFKSYIGKYNDEAVNELEEMIKTEYVDTGIGKIKANTYSEIMFQCKRYYVLNTLSLINAWNTTIDNAIQAVEDMLYEV